MDKKFQIPTHWDEKQIICSLYYLVANSDNDLKKEEVTMIDRKLDALMSTFMLAPDQKYKIANEAMNLVLSLDDQVKIEFVKELSSQVIFSPEMFTQVLTSLEDIAQSDDYVSIEEHSLMYYIRLKFKKDYARAVAYC